VDEISPLLLFTLDATDIAAGSQLRRQLTERPRVHGLSSTQPAPRR
jgi:hypothetical protein